VRAVVGGVVCQWLGLGVRWTCLGGFAVIERGVKGLHCCSLDVYSGGMNMMHRARHEHGKWSNDIRS
jgi:hypothetical protein